MIRLIALSAAAAACIALPASAQVPSLRISTAGKSAEQVKTEVFKAAERLCGREINGTTFSILEQRACVRNTTRTTLAQSSDPALKLASR
jgi:hypothetical protein